MSESTSSLFLGVNKSSAMSITQFFQKIRIRIMLFAYIRLALSLCIKTFNLTRIVGLHTKPHSATDNITDSTLRNFKIRIHNCLYFGL